MVFGTFIKMQKPCQKYINKYILKEDPVGAHASAGLNMKKKLYISNSLV